MKKLNKILKTSVWVFILALGTIGITSCFGSDDDDGGGTVTDPIVGTWNLTFLYMLVTSEMQPDSDTYILTNSITHAEDLGNVLVRLNADGSVTSSGDFTLVTQMRQEFTIDGETAVVETTTTDETDASSFGSSWRREGNYLVMTVPGYGEVRHYINLLNDTELHLDADIPQTEIPGITYLVSNMINNFVRVN